MVWCVYLVAREAGTTGDIYRGKASGQLWPKEELRKFQDGVAIRLDCRRLSRHPLTYRRLGQQLVACYRRRVRSGYCLMSGQSSGTKLAHLRVLWQQTLLPIDDRPL